MITTGLYVCRCGKKSVKKDMCGFCRQKENLNENVVCVCRCGQEFITIRKNVNDHNRRRTPFLCRDCRGKESGDRINRVRASLTPEEMADCQKRSLEKRKTKASETVSKQWATIKGNPEEYKKLLVKRKDNMQKVWDNMESEEKNRRIKSWFVSHGCRRSKGNEKLKKMMQDENLYDGFVSEQVFCGYIPDEINHEIKMVIEYYGDAYHCNPSIYKDENQFVNLIKRTVGEQWKRDRKRLGVFYRQGYSVVIVWAKDFSNRAKAELERIRNEITRKREASRIV